MAEAAPAVEGKAGGADQSKLKNIEVNKLTKKPALNIYLNKLLWQYKNKCWTNKMIIKGKIIKALVTLLLIASAPALADNSNSIKTESYTIQLKDGISLQMIIVPFDAKKHKIKNCQILDWSGICLIDGKPVFGTDWELPKNQLIKSSVKIGALTIALDVSCMYNPFFGEPDLNNFKAEEVEGGYLIHGSFSDGAGSYEAEWFIIQNRSVRTQLQKKEC